MIESAVMSDGGTAIDTLQILDLCGLNGVKIFKDNQDGSSCAAELEAR